MFLFSFLLSTLFSLLPKKKDDVFALLKAKWSLKKLLLLKGDRLIKKGDAILLFGRHGDRTFPKSGL